ncbi:MAG: hypothetical protein P8X74_03890 [Reinekea sp.]
MFSPADDNMPQFSCKKEEVSKRMFGVFIQRFIRHDWQIIKAKKQPMTAEEWHKKQGFPSIKSVEITERENLISFNYSDFCSALENDIISAFNAGVENTHLIYDELISSIEKHLDYYGNCYHDEIATELEKIKQHRSKTSDKN